MRSLDFSSSKNKNLVFESIGVVDQMSGHLKRGSFQATGKEKLCLNSKLQLRDLSSIEKKTLCLEHKSYEIRSHQANRNHFVCFIYE